MRKSGLPVTCAISSACSSVGTQKTSSAPRTTLVNAGALAVTESASRTIARRRIISGLLQLLDGILHFRKVCVGGRSISHMGDLALLVDEETGAARHVRLATAHAVR